MTKTLRALIIVLLALTPIFNVGEVYAFTFGGLRSQVEIITPLWVKLIKDALFFAITIVAVIDFARRTLRERGVHPFVWAYVPLFVVALVSLPITYLTNENARAPGYAIFLLAGARWFLPFVLAFLLIDKTDDKLMRQLAIVCTVLVVLSFAVQVYQMFYAKNWFGKNILGLQARVSGIFLLPATSGFFVCVAVFLSWFHLKGSKLRWVAPIIAPFSIWASASAAAIIIFGVMVLLLSFGGRFLKFKLALLPLLALVLFLNIGDITGRRDFEDVSGPVRFRHMAQSLQEVGLVSNQFGFGTNSAVLLNVTFKLTVGPEVLDSMIATLIVNLGFVGVLAFAFLFVALGVLAWKSRRLDGFIFILIYLMAGIGQPFTESFPMNLIFSVWLGYFVAQAWQPKFGLTRNFLSLFTRESAQAVLTTGR